MKLTTHLHLLLRSRICSYTSTPQYAFMAWCSGKEHRDKCILLLPFILYCMIK